MFYHQSHTRQLKLSALCALLLSLLTLSASPREAEALPFIDIGAKVATGSGVFGPEGASATIIGGGAVARLDLPIVSLELNALYLSSEIEYGEGALASTSTFGMLSIPVIMRVSVLPLPIVDIAVGGGVERRVYLGDHADIDPVDLIPLSITGDFSIPVLGTVGVEARFNYSLADVDEPMHETMLLAHLLF